jgi:hypothetical protein
MPAVSFEWDNDLNPDDLKMPERALHRQTVDLLALGATERLGPAVWVFRDLNWYPDDGAGPVAPDIMVLPRSALDELPTSYRQEDVVGPPPLVVVEVASDSDTFASLRAKAHRYRRLGTTAYVVVLDDDQCVLRLGPSDVELVSWTAEPIPELGDLCLEFADGEPLLTLPDGTTGRSDADLMAAMRRRAEVAEGRAEVAEGRAEALAAQLRVLGVEPADIDDR